MTQPVRGGAVALFTPRGWTGALITGPSGAGKSDLALRLIGRGLRLVSDDYAWVWRSGEGVFASAPERLSGRIEARGVGILPAPARPLTRLRLVVACQAEPPERLPEPEMVELAGLRLPLLRVRPFEASAADKVAGALLTL